MLTRKDEENFAEAIAEVLADGDALENVIDWISDNLAPEAIFDEEKLKDHIKGNYEPDDVFDEKELEKWAEENGFEKKE